MCITVTRFGKMILDLVTWVCISDLVYSTSAVTRLGKIHSLILILGIHLLPESGNPDFVSRSVFSHTGETLSFTCQATASHRTSTTPPSAASNPVQVSPPVNMTQLQAFTIVTLLLFIISLLLCMIQYSLYVLAQILYEK